MSLASKVTFGAACCATFGIVGYVHLKQSIDRERLHEGVIKDVERQQRRKAENLYVLQQQSDLAKQYRQEQRQQERQRAEGEREADTS
ncbi:protein PET117 homolog, mitochondrial-like [Eriocheir sinensis]|uniref:protein PET117 homolog, mitochondrial-like n=1 Tax=Eriocheir sinensis TaxID=95602 RepID=UPI0021C7C7F1|nr:protein PET117 homolog, mitochondrial-like [Eriocheir sinensis]